MQIQVSCMTCAVDSDSLGTEHLGWASVTSLAINEWTCPKGHVNRFFLTEPFYQQLFEEAVWDLVLRDTREAVTAFYSAWDNFVAHTADMLLSEFGAAVELPRDAKRAEPRRGAFIALLLAKTHGVPRLPTNKTAETRNLVIHDDKMPSEEDTFTVGEDIQECILRCQSSLPGLHEEYGHGAKSLPRRMRLFEAAQLKPEDLVGVAQTIRMSRIHEKLRARVAGIRKELPQPRAKAT